MKVTRTILADVPAQLAGICKTAGYIRADIWRRYGALGNVGVSASAVRTEIIEKKIYDSLRIDGTIRAETTKDIVNNILTYKAAAKLKVRQAIAKRTTDENERKRLYTLLKTDEWLSDSFLHRQMRKHFRHGRSEVANQFIVRSDKYSTEVVNGKLVITVKIAKKYGDNIMLTTTTSGKNVDLSGSNLRIIVKDGFTEIHYATEKGGGRECGDQVLGIDKGYTEAFTDSDGDHHGQNFGRVMTEYSDKVAATGKHRNRLHALEKKHREAGRIAKAERIKKNNLGCKKIDARKGTTQKRLRTIAYQAAHSIVDKARIVASEDLTAVIASKHQWKRFNRRMSAWAKGVLAEALDSVCEQRDARNILVNGAYTSQMDSTNGLLEGKREGDKFYRANGDVLQADYNAALNVLARLDDREISRFTPYKEVRRILLSRSPAQLSVKRVELGTKVRQPTADKSYAQICATFWEQVPMAVAKKKPVTEAGGLPYSADTVNAYIRHANAKLGVMSNTTIRLPMTTGTLSIDLLLFGGPSGGKFMTSFGPEKAFKTTTMTECLVWYIAQEIKWRRYIAANPEASRPPPITLVYWDYENSLHTSDSGAIFSMLRKWVPDVRRVEVFGDDANLPAVYVYSEIPDLETMFEHIELLSEAIPPMAMINGRWFWKMESLPAGVIRDEAVSKLTGVPCVSAPQPIPAQVLVFTDSIPAMAPRAGIGPDKSAAMALQARAFSQALTTTQNYRVSRRMMVWAANQLRERPASGNANPNYEVGGNALRYFSDVRMSHSPQAYKTFSPPSHMPQLDKEQRCYESTWNGAGQDTYSFLKITTTKNKLDGARDQLSIKLRVWATTNGASQLGIDPVYDVYQALEMMSLMEKKVGDNYRVLAFGLENAAKGMTWQQLKTLVLFRFESDEMYNAVVAIFNDLRLPESLEPFNLRDAVYDLIHHGDGVNRWSTNVFGYEDTSVTDDMVAVEGDTPDQAAAYAKVAPSGYPVVAR